MNLTKPYGPQDEVSMRNGDRFFLGVDERRSPQQLEEGKASYGKNVRFRKGKAETRRGVLICPWMKTNGRVPWTEVYGGIVYSDPNDNGDWFIIAADGGVWKTRPNMTAQAVSLPLGVTLTADTFSMFVPVTDGGVGVLVMLRGADNDPLVCTNLDAGFAAVPASPLSVADPLTGESGIFDMPRSSYGINHLNRLMLIEGKDIVAVSDILAYNQFIPTQNEYRINPGNSQALVQLQPMSNQTLICFKTQSVLMVTQVKNDTDGSLFGVGPDVVTESYGLAGVRAVVRKGSNCYWITNEPSVTSLRLTELNETQDTDVRLSDALPETFGRINSIYLSRACLEVWDGKLYAALPLDDASAVGGPMIRTDGGTLFSYFALVIGQSYQWIKGNGNVIASGSQSYTADTTFVATDALAEVTFAASPWTGSLKQVVLGVNTGVAVYDFVNQAWCGVDEALGVFAIKTWLKTTFLGRQRLFSLGVDGVIRLHEEGFEDEVFSGSDIVVQAISTTLRTRGYTLDDGDRHRSLAAVCKLRSWDPRYTLTTLNQGYNTDADEQTAVTRNRFKYDQNFTADWDPNNTLDDHATPGREDYSITLNDPDGVSLGALGIDIDAHQISTERVPLSNVGDWQQIELTNDQGRLELLGVTVEQQPHERRSGVGIV